METIDISPAPALVQTALDHCDIPLVVLDDHTVNISMSPAPGIGRQPERAAGRGRSHV